MLASALNGQDVVAAPAPAVVEPEPAGRVGRRARNGSRSAVERVVRQDTAEVRPVVVAPILRQAVPNGRMYHSVHAEATAEASTGRHHAPAD